jgi:hypothetical protein
LVRGRKRGKGEGESKEERDERGKEGRVSLTYIAAPSSFID